MARTIITQYHGPTNTKGPRISATTFGGPRIYVRCERARPSPQDHVHAAMVFAEKIGWTGTFVGGDIEKGMAFVNLVGHAERFTV